MSVDISDRVPDGFAGSGGAMVPFEDIHIGDKIGGGAFSTVHKGTFRGNEVAIKVVQAQQDLSKYLEAELAILGYDTHSSLCQC